VGLFTEGPSKGCHPALFTQVRGSLIRRSSTTEVSQIGFLAPRHWRLSWTRLRLGLCLKHDPKGHRTSPMGCNELLKGSVRHVELILLLGEAVQPSAGFVDEQDVPG
jgi:hypothetical protein